MGEKSGSKAAKGASWTVRGYAEQSKSLANSALITAPIVLMYEIGLLLLGDRAIPSAAGDLIDRGLMALGRPAALAITLLVLAGLVVLAFRTAPGKATPLGLFLPVLLESAAYACVLDGAMRLSRRMLAAPLPPGLAEGVVLALGAGFYEELVFRLAAVGGALVVLERAFRVRSPWATVVVMAASAVSFSAFHHIGRGGEAFETARFVMRSVGGVLLGGLFILRGFGVACWAHVIYDLLCLRSI